MIKLRLFCGLALAGFAALRAQPIQAQNFLVNSNFASGDFTGWTVAESGTGGDPKDYGVTSTTDGGSTVPNAGDTFGAYFNPAGGTMNLSQTVNLPAAGTYIITCSVEPVFNDADILVISLAGTPVSTNTFEFAEPYTPISVSVLAEAGSQAIDFQLTPGSGPMFFDDAGLVPVDVVTSPPPPPPPATTVCSALGSASGGAVIGLKGAAIHNFWAKVEGDEYVSVGGVLDNLRPSVIEGNVFEYATNEYFGRRGGLKGGVTVDAALLSTVDTDASNAAVTIAAMTPTQAFGSIRHATTITGNGGVNVIAINGDISHSLILSGDTNDVFFVNVSGTIDLRNRATLGVSGGVTAGSVIYNLTGKGEVRVEGDVVNGTILAPGYRMELEGEFNGAIIGGGKCKPIDLFFTKVKEPVCPQ